MPQRRIARPAASPSPTRRLADSPLYARLEREGRLRGELDPTDNTKLFTNVVPKRIGYTEMIGAYKSLYARLLTDRGIADRIRNKLRHLGQPVYRGEYRPAQRIGIVARLVVRGVVPGGLPRIHQFLRSLPWLAPRKLPLAIVDWIAGLAMRDYVRRYFEQPAEHLRAPVEQRLASMRAYIARRLREGGVSMGAQATRIDLALRLDSLAGRRFFRGLARHLDGLLRV